MYIICILFYREAKKSSYVELDSDKSRQHVKLGLDLANKRAPQKMNW